MNNLFHHVSQEGHQQAFSSTFLLPSPNLSQSPGSLFSTLPSPCSFPNLTTQFYWEHLSPGTPPPKRPMQHSFPRGACVGVMEADPRGVGKVKGYRWSTWEGQRSRPATGTWATHFISSSDSPSIRWRRAKISGVTSGFHTLILGD